MIGHSVAIAMFAAWAAHAQEAPAAPAAPSGHSEPADSPPVVGTLKTVALADLQGIITAQGHTIVDSSTDAANIWVNARTSSDIQFSLTATDCTHRDEAGCHAMLMTVLFDNPRNDVSLDRINKANLRVPSTQSWLDRAQSNQIGFSRLVTLHGGRTRRSLELELELLLLEFWAAYDEIWPNQAEAG